MKGADSFVKRVPEKESVLKKLEQFQQKKSHHKTTSTPPNREESL